MICKIPILCLQDDHQKCLSDRLLEVCFSLETLAGIMRRDYLAQRRMGRDLGAAPSSPLGHTTLSRLLLCTANAICVRADWTLFQVTLREKNRLPADYLRDGLYCDGIHSAMIDWLSHSFIRLLIDSLIDWLTGHAAANFPTLGVTNGKWRTLRDGETFSWLPKLRDREYLELEIRLEHYITMF